MFDDAATSRLTPSQRDARRRLSAVVDAVGRSASRVATEPYRPSDVAILSRIAPSDATADLGVDPGHRDWPLGNLASIGAGNPPSGDYGAEYTIVRRPLLPDEHACPTDP